MRYRALRTHEWSDEVLEELRRARGARASAAAGRRRARRSRRRRRSLSRVGRRAWPSAWSRLPALRPRAAPHGRRVARRGAARPPPPARPRAAPTAARRRRPGAAARAARHRPGRRHLARAPRTDLRAAGNVGYFADTRTRGSACRADWPSRSPTPASRPDDPLQPGARNLHALDEQIALARADGIRLSADALPLPDVGQRDRGAGRAEVTDAEISFQHRDRMTEAAWKRYVRERPRPGRLLAAAGARSSTCCPTTPTGPPAPGRGFFAFLYDRYHYGQRASGRWVDGFELVNEPNLQLWPQHGAVGRPPSRSPRPRHDRPRGRAAAATAQGSPPATAHARCSTRPRSATATPRPAASTRATTSSCRRCSTRSRRSATCRTRGQAWSHHNYTDVEKRQTAHAHAARSAAQLAGRWAGVRRPGRRRPCSSPRAARGCRGCRDSTRPRTLARRRRSACATRGRCTRRDTGAGAGRGDVRPVPALRRPQLRLRAARPVPVHGETPGLCGLEGVSRVLVSC